ncbi:hypothetical protein B0H10DRAFT_448118 [Mycena sp. CBHHK59/15]|nr:hypothetical protein B0H10DRAFT_448118 [Mycena sp. CBHHK59/15]
MRSTRRSRSSLSAPPSSHPRVPRPLSPHYRPHTVDTVLPPPSMRRAAVPALPVHVAIVRDGRRRVLRHDHRLRYTRLKSTTRVPARIPNATCTTAGVLCSCGGCFSSPTSSSSSPLRGPRPTSAEFRPRRSLLAPAAVLSITTSTFRVRSASGGRFPSHTTRSSPLGATSNFGAVPPSPLFDVSPSRMQHHRRPQHPRQPSPIARAAFSAYPRHASILGAIHPATRNARLPRTTNTMRTTRGARGASGAFSFAHTALVAHPRARIIVNILPPLPIDHPACAHLSTTYIAGCVYRDDSAAGEQRRNSD